MKDQPLVLYSIGDFIWHRTRSDGGIVKSIDQKQNLLIYKSSFSDLDISMDLDNPFVEVMISAINFANDFNEDRSMFNGLRRGDLVEMIGSKHPAVILNYGFEPYNQVSVLSPHFNYKRYFRGAGKIEVKSITNIIKKYETTRK